MNDMKRYFYARIVIGECDNTGCHFGPEFGAQSIGTVSPEYVRRDGQYQAITDYLKAAMALVVADRKVQENIINDFVKRIAELDEDRGTR